MEATGLVEGFAVVVAGSSKIEDADLAIGVVDLGSPKIEDAGLEATGSVDLGDSSKIDEATFGAVL